MGRFSLNKLPTDVLQEIAFKLKNLRKAKKLSQLKLAERSGVSLGSVKRFEQTGQISFESLLKLAHLLGRLHDFDSLFVSKQSDNVADLFSDKMRKG